MNIKFAFIGEGSSDNGLVIPLANLCISLGATSAESIIPDFSHSDLGHALAPRIIATHKIVPDANIIFIHRDADAEDGSDHRKREIATAIANAHIPVLHVPVVPVQETEAWLLLEEETIRTVVGNPNGRTPLNLPNPRSIHRIASPKELLSEILLRASEERGRRLAKLRQRLPRLRNQLLEGLNIDGVIREVAAWQELEEDLRSVLENIQKGSTSSIPPL